MNLIFRLFRYAYPSSSLRCSRKRPSLLSLACASGRLSFAVGERYYCCVYCDLFPRTYIRRRLIPYYDSGPLHKHQTYVRPIFNLPLEQSYRKHTYISLIKILRSTKIHHVQKEVDVQQYLVRSTYVHYVIIYLRTWYFVAIATTTTAVA